VVEGARLESVFRGNSNVGSNPTLSARDPSKRVRSSPVEEPKYKKINNNPSKPVHPFPAEARVAKV
jgi:hypothetical protein